jgi:putative ABC transport system ATP-binding protein
MLSFENVTKKFRLDDVNSVTPVDNLCLSIDAGEMVVVIGRSGTGKSTLLNLAAGLVRPTSGQVTIDNTDLTTMSDAQVSRLRSSQIGFIFQFPSLLSALTVKDNVTLPSIFVPGEGRGRAGERADGLLEALGVGSKASVYPRQLSAGEQKRVVIARAMINQPRLVLADEPTSDLDTRTEKDIMRLLREINSSGVTFLIVTHSLELVSFATRAFEMEKGNLTQIPTTTPPPAGHPVSG